MMSVYEHEASCEHMNTALNCHIQIHIDAFSGLEMSDLAVECFDCICLCVLFSSPISVIYVVV